MNNHTETLTDPLVELLEQQIAEYSIILYNDDYNTFDHVISCLMRYCDHDMIQAEQCAWVVHTNGKCVVKHGIYEDLEPICVGLLDKGLSAKIE
ncbi:MAG: ATP-dependent Clp protease adaptor ClpS [Flavobacteriales bacterium]|jgi:ATP-dependent Clp protease adaptor protein ClpS|nr:ATP-dependent Clp protease adaptor ClpS [Flavobacteriales bacterium]